MLRGRHRFSMEGLINYLLCNLQQIDYKRLMESSHHKDIWLIRHGQSEYNLAAQAMREKLNIKADWQAYLTNQQFIDLKYSPKMMDCSLSDFGKQKCHQLSNEQEFFSQFDLIVVSPLYRALITSHILFDKVRNQNQNQKFVVDPVFGQSLRCACDISYKLHEAKKQFSHYDFTLVEGKEHDWYLENQKKEKRQRYLNSIEKTNKEVESQEKSEYETTTIGVLKHMKETFEYEDHEDLFERRNMMIEKLKAYSQQYKKICIVSHYYTMLYLMTQDYHPNGKPLTKLPLDNCKPYKLKFRISQKNNN